MRQLSLTYFLKTKPKSKYVEEKKNYHITTFLHYEQKKHFNIYVYTQLVFVYKEKETPFFTLPKNLYELDG